jgi:acyl-coenzyme A thioesterase PaaI-like protein
MSFLDPSLDLPRQMRLKFQQATPFARAIGLELTAIGEGTATTRLAPSPPIHAATDTDAIHPFALIGMADHALSYAFVTTTPPESGLSTLDLRIDFGPPPIGAVTAEVTALRIGPHNGTVALTAQDAAGQNVLRATALFNFRAFPGGGAHMRRPDKPRFSNDHNGPFPAFLGLHQDNDGTWLEGGHRRTVGFEGLPALHGGVTGALLAFACHAEAARTAPAAHLSTLHLRYLRPAGLARLNTTTVVTRAGRSATFLDAICAHTPTEPIATAQATFVPD